MPTSRRIFISTFVLASCLVATAGLAAGQMPYTDDAFAAAKADNKPILVEITAPWCPTCKAQKPILSEIAAQPKYKDLMILEVDFDSQKDIVRSLGAQMQSTLIVFKGPQEVGRSVGDTNPASIAAMVEKAI
jgi:thioredoxin 1